jgi:hypothetical protein
MHQRGTREELVSELRKMSEGWYRLCKDKLSAAAPTRPMGSNKGPAQ